MYNNHLLFAAIIETFLLKVGEQVDQAKVFLACKKIEEWYVGDGWYSDGPSFSDNREIREKHHFSVL